jgi:hypothetical protein
VAVGKVVAKGVRKAADSKAHNGLLVRKAADNARHLEEVAASTHNKCSAVRPRFS